MARHRSPGEGGVEQLPSGNWRAVIAKRRPDGKKDRVSATFPTKTAALDWIRQRKNEQAAGTLFTQRTTLGDYLTEWLTRKTPTVQPGTAHYYARLVERLRSFPIVRDPMPKLTRQGIEAASARWGTPSQTRKLLTLLQIVCNDAVRDGIIAQSPAADVRKPAYNSLRNPFWSAVQTRAILEAALDSPLAGLFFLGFDSGMRPGELLGLHWPEVDLTAGIVRVIQSLEDVEGKLRLKEPKTRKGVRSVRIGSQTTDVLRQHREQMAALRRNVTSGPVFVGQRTAGLISHSTFYAKYFKPVVKAAGVPFHSPYAMRHTCATLLLANGVNIKVVSERLGHEDISTTLRHYAHCLPDSQAEAAAAVDSIFTAPRRPHESELPG